MLRALVQASAARLAPAMAGLGPTAILPGWQVRVLDGDHVPGTEKRIAPRRGHRGAARPGPAVVVYDPDSGLVLDRMAGEDAHQTERVPASILLSRAEAGQVWVADRHVCTRALLEGWEAAGACFVVREHANHPRIVERGPWHDGGRRDTVIRIWSNLPDSVSAGQIVRAYKHRWNSEGLFGQLESVLHSEIRSLGQPRAACLASLQPRYWPTTCWRLWRAAWSGPMRRPRLCRCSNSPCTSAAASMACRSPCRPSRGVAGLVERLLQLARPIDPKRVAASKRAPKHRVPNGYVDGKAARAHVATAHVMAEAKMAP